MIDNDDRKYGEESEKGAVREVEREGALRSFGFLFWKRALT